MQPIKFSHTYCKMPPCFWSRDKDRTFLIGMAIVEDVQKLPKEFLDWDTAYPVEVKGEDGKTIYQNIEHYELFKGKGLILTLFTLGEIGEGQIMESVWTTIRRWTPDKEIYYKGLVGQQVEIVITD